MESSLAQLACSPIQPTELDFAQLALRAPSFCGKISTYPPLYYAPSKWSESGPKRLCCVMCPNTTNVYFFCCKWAINFECMCKTLIPQNDLEVESVAKMLGLELELR
jgi:hypothetical protein